jgi:hypothetical protein
LSFLRGQLRLEFFYSGFRSVGTVAFSFSVDTFLLYAFAAAFLYAFAAAFPYAFAAAFLSEFFRYRYFIIFFCQHTHYLRAMLLKEVFVNYTWIVK